MESGGREGSPKWAQAETGEYLRFALCFFSLVFVVFEPHNGSQGVTLVLYSGIAPGGAWGNPIGCALNRTHVSRMQDKCYPSCSTTLVSSH